MTKKSVSITLIIILAVIVLLLIKPILWIISINFEVAYHEKNKLRMQQPEIYIPVAESLAQYCRAVNRKIPLYGCSYLPDNIRQLRPLLGYISPVDADLQMLGGFDHYGYDMQKEEDATWTLYYYSDDTGRKKLHQVFLDEKPLLITMDTIKTKIEEYFDKSLLKQPKEYSLHESRILYFVDMGEDDKAISACEKSLHTLPDYGWLYLMRSLLISKKNKEKAMAELIQWANENPGYMNYFYLFYFAKEMGEKKLACDSIENAIRQSLAKTENYNVYYYSFQMTKYAYENGGKETAIKVCDAMIDPAREKERRASADSDYIHFVLLKRAIQDNQDDVFIDWSKRIDDYHPYKGHGSLWETGMEGT